MPRTLEQLIKDEFGCDVRYAGFQQVRETFQGKAAWEGTVQIFDLIGHPKANTVYAWRYEQNGETKTVTVLKEPPVDSPHAAVQVAIAAKARHR